jgi:hypothetical protein
MRAHPEMVAGTDEEGYDTHLMRGVPGLICKVGAEGVIAAAVPGKGAVAMKVDDGSARARLPVLVAALARLGLTGAVLNQYAKMSVLGGGRAVGEIVTGPTSRATWVRLSAICGATRASRSVSSPNRRASATHISARSSAGCASRAPKCSLSWPTRFACRPR